MPAPDATRPSPTARRRSAAAGRRSGSAAQRPVGGDPGIDFDLVRPASRVDEVVNLLMWWGAWMPADDRETAMCTVDPARRGRLLVDAYGLDAELRPHVVPTSVLTAQRTWPRMKERAERLGGGWARMWNDGGGERILRREQWLRENAEVLTDALVRRSS